MVCSHFLLVEDLLIATFSLSQEKPPIKVISTLGAIAVVSSDEDLIDAAISELQTIPLDRQQTEDPSGQSDLVLYSHALAKGDEQDALAVLEAAVHAQPSCPGARNRLAKMLIALGRAEEAISVLAAQERIDRTMDVAETLRLRGIAEVLNANADGVKMSQKAVKLRPWDLVTWQALAWVRRRAEDVAA